MIVLGPHVAPHSHRPSSPSSGSFGGGNKCRLECDDVREDYGPREDNDGDDDKGDDDDDEALMEGTFVREMEGGGNDDHRDGRDSGEEEDDDDNDNDSNNNDDDNYNDEGSMVPRRRRRRRRRPSAMPPSRRQEYDNDDAWSGARLVVSSVLGSIGAPPLRIAPPHPKRHRRNPSPRGSGGCRRGERDERTTDERRTSLFRVVVDFAYDHAKLVDSMSVALATLRDCTGMRLGLGGVVRGTTRCGKTIGGAVVDRAERAYAARCEEGGGVGAGGISGGGGRRDRWTAKCDGGDVVHDVGLTTSTTLTFQRLRDVLHLAIIDQAVSLRDVFVHSRLYRCNFEDDDDDDEQYVNGEDIHDVNIAVMCANGDVGPQLDGWDVFVDDLRSTMTNDRRSRPTLTLSQLSSWVHRLGGYLSHVLSELLYRDDLGEEGGGEKDGGNAILERIDMSSLFARERSSYLRAACPTSRPPTKGDVDGVVVSSAPTPRAYAYASGEDALSKMHIALESARISLWAFEMSRPERRCQFREGDCDEGKVMEGEIDEDPRVWFHHLKEFIGRTYASIPEIEDQFLLRGGFNDMDEGNDEEEEEEGSNGTSKNEGPVVLVSECSENVGGDGGSTSRLLSDCASGEGGDVSSLYAGKTMVFSGSGEGASSVRRRRRPGDRPPSSPSYFTPSAFDGAADRDTLLRDLEARIKAMGLSRDEHEVVIATEADKCADVVDEVIDDDASRPRRIDGRDDTNRDGGVRMQSAPFFLGASGSLLAELVSAMNVAPRF